MAAVSLSGIISAVAGWVAIREAAVSPEPAPQRGTT
jgi:hypothetical protein